MLVLDNARFHHAKKLKNFFKFFHIHYLAPYSPFNNPIEEVFGNAKYHYRRMILENSHNLDKNILKAFSQIKQRNFYAFYAHSISFWSKCYNSEPID